MKNIKQLNEEGYLAIDFYLSKSCNKSCHYCTAWTLEMRNLDVDMEFLSKLREIPQLTLKYVVTNQSLYV